MKHKAVKIQRIDGDDHSNLATGTTMNTFSGTAAIGHTSCGTEGAFMGRNVTESLFKQFHMKCEKFSSNEKNIKNVASE